MTEEAKKLAFSTPPDFILRLMNITEQYQWIKQKREYVSGLFEHCSNADEANILIHALEVFEYLDGNRLELALAAITDQITKTWNLDPQFTCIVCKDIEGKTDSSAALQQMIKPHFAIKEGWFSNKNFPSNIAKVISNTKITNIVLIDDFSGTGKSLVKLCDWISEKCKENERNQINVYAGFVATMEPTWKQKYNGNLKGIYGNITLKKVISEHYPTQINEKIINMRSIENSYGKIPRSYSLGFAQSEAAFHVQKRLIPFAQVHTAN